MSDNATVQSFINAGYIPAGTYNIDCSAPLFVRSGTNLQIDGTLVVIPNSLPVSAVIEINGVSNVVITGGTIVGDILTHSGTEGRGGGLISVLHSSNIIISGMDVVRGWADGIYLQDNNNVHVIGTICNGCGRNGMSIISGQGVSVIGCSFLNTKSVDPFPQAGIDIEPDNPGEILVNVDITGNTFTNNHGAGVYIGFTPSPSIAGISVTGNTFNQHYKDNAGPPVRGANSWLANLCYALFRWVPGYDWWFFKSGYSA